jgi:hypothetical protein
MNSSNLHDGQLNLKKICGIIFLLIALFGLYWVAEAIAQLWNSPKSVPFVSLFIDLLEENQEPILRSTKGGEINLPASWPIVVGVFLSIVLISSVGLLIRSFLSNAMYLLFPGQNTTKGWFAIAIERITSKRSKKP